MSAMQFRLPQTDEHTCIFGMNGSGKTQLAKKILSGFPLHRFPFVIIDYKRMDFRHIGAEKVGLNWRPRRSHKSGLYLVQPMPLRDDDAVEDLLWAIHSRRRMGIFADEALRLPNREALQTLLTQGRAYRIPMILCSQRPAWLPREVYSESMHVGVLRLSLDDDKKRIEEMTPIRLRWRHNSQTGRREEIPPLPPYHSWWYDVRRDNKMCLAPAPDGAVIDEDLRQATRKWWF